MKVGRVVASLAAAAVLASAAIAAAPAPVAESAGAVSIQLSCYSNPEKSSPRTPSTR